MAVKPYNSILSINQLLENSDDTFVIGKFFIYFYALIINELFIGIHTINDNFSYY